MATRTEQLAKPKPNLLRFPDRRSVYWIDELPPERSRSPTRFELTPHWSQLCEKKRQNPVFEQTRHSPISRVRASAMKACPSSRVISLALPRLPSGDWQPDRPVLGTLSRAVQTAIASPRICQLAWPKRRLGLKSAQSFQTALPTFHPVPVTSRVQVLATPKPEHPQYLVDRPVSRHIPRQVREAVPSERVQVLSRAKKRTALFEGYNPYIVSQAARAATASPRIQELCVPIARKYNGK